jgi:hypothetical protein
VVATYGAAALIIIASLLIGRAFLEVLGRRETWWLESSVGLAILICVSGVLTRGPGRATTSLVVCAVLVVVSIAYLRFRFVDLPSLAMATPVVLLTLLLASLPFIASGHIGIPGVGINNDMASHLLWTDWLQDPTGPEPTGIRIGYPLGPHGLVATLSDGLGTEPLYGFLGLLLALPVITALTSLNLLHGLPPVRRTVAAALVALPYMAASTLGIGGFKELAVGLFLLSFALILRTLTREEEGRVALVAALGVLAGGIVLTYSYPGLAWPAAAFGIWAIAELGLAARQGRMAAVREDLRRAAPLLIAAGVVAAIVVATQIPRILDFARSDVVDIVQNTDSKLRTVVSPLEALGSWPSGEFLFGKHRQLELGNGDIVTVGLEDWQIFGAIGVIALLVALFWWIRRLDLALPAGVAGAAIVYLGTVARGGFYIQSKAIAVPAALVMLLITGALLAREGGRARYLVAIPFLAIAAYSSFLALRDTVVAPQDRFDEQRDLRSAVAGQNLLSLTSDRFADYGLRGAEVFSPAANAEQQVDAQVTKNQRLPVDFDSAPARVLNGFPLAVTTSAPYQSQPPPGWTLIESTDSYKLYQREGETPPISILYEEARPGRVFRCQNPKLAAFLGGGGEPLIWTRPVIAKRLFWEPTNSLEPGAEASQEIKLPPGDWDLSIQYASPVAGIEVEAPGLEASLPPGVEAAIPFRPDQGPYWTVGRVGGGSKITVTVKADELSTLQKLLGVDAPAVIGNITAVQTAGVHLNPLAASCGLYVDHIIGGEQQTRTAPGRG